MVWEGYDTFDNPKSERVSQPGMIDMARFKMNKWFLF